MTFRVMPTEVLWRIPIAGGEHEFTFTDFVSCWRLMRLDYIQFDTNRVGGITQARKNRRPRRSAILCL